jgi:hypothetical protein
MRFVILVCELCLLVATVSAQGAKTNDSQYVIAPSEYIFLAVATQPDCPLRIEEAQLLIPVGEGRPEYRYKLSNKGGKPINYFKVVAWSAEGTGGTLGGPPPWDGRVTDRLLQAGESVRVGRDDVVVVPLDPPVREKLHLRGKLQTLVVLLVDQITFADGTKYDFQAASKSLIEYFSVRRK